MDPRDCVPARPPIALSLQRWTGHVLWYCGLTALARRCQRHRGTARILAYHHVLPPTNRAARARLPWTMYTDADAFARQMRYVARHYCPLPLPALVDLLAHGASIPARSVAITLDDGYRDQLAHALPVLRATGLPAAFAVVARAGASPSADVGQWDEEEDLATDAELRTAGEAGVTLVAHSATHQDLTACDAAVLRAELTGSRRHLRALGGADDLFCYPGGMHNAAVRAAVAAAGYRAALSCAPGANGSHTDPFALRRVLVGASPDHFVAAQLAGLFDGPAWLYHGLNRVQTTLRRHGPHWRGRRGLAVRGNDSEGRPRCRCETPPRPITPPLAADVWPRVTVAVPTYNEHDMIDLCLRSILAQDYPHDRLEVLVVDGGSTDDTVARSRRYPGVRVLHNSARDAESAKVIGLREAHGDLFMYLDADAEYAHLGWLRAMVAPLRDDPTLVASFTRFLPRPGAPALDRYLNYHPLQLGPLLRHLCVDIASTGLEVRGAYTLCCFGGGRVPPVGLCLYRVAPVRALIAGVSDFRWIDVGIPARLAEAGHGHLAYVPQAGLHHGRRATLRSLVARQRRDATTTYLPRAGQREFRYVEFSSPRAVLGLVRWVLRVNLLAPPVVEALLESWRRRDAACLYGGLLAVLETDGVLLAFLRHPQGRALARRGIAAVGAALIGGRTWRQRESRGRLRLGMTRPSQDGDGEGGSESANPYLRSSIIAVNGTRYRDAPQQATGHPSHRRSGATQ